MKLAPVNGVNASELVVVFEIDVFALALIFRLFIR